MQNGSSCGNHLDHVRGADRMMRKNGEASVLRPGLVATLLMLISVTLACGGGQQVQPSPSPTAGPSFPLSFDCAVTEILPLETPLLIARGQDPLPSGFDAVNSAECTFTEPVDKVTLELLRDGDVVYSQRVAVDPADVNIRFPITAANLVAVPSNLALGSYDRRIEAGSVNGVTAEVRFDSNLVWVLDPRTGDKDSARKALIAARQAYVEAQALPYIGPAMLAFDPVEWGDTSLGCPMPGMVYAQVITPGFRLVFDYQGQKNEYHTDQDGSSVVACDTDTGS